MNTLLICTSALLILASPSWQQCLTSDDASQNIDHNSRTALYVGQQQFSFDMLKQLALAKSTDPTKSLFFSPYSVYMALMLAFFGSAGVTEHELRNTLHLGKLDKLNALQAYHVEKLFSRMRALNGTTSGSELRTANRLFFDSHEQVRECMQDLMGEEIERLDFMGQSETCRQTINAWVEEQTVGHIKDLLTPGSVDQSTRLVLANCAYFRGQWISKFPVSNTKKEVFYSSQKDRTFVDMMKVTGVFKYDASEELGAHILELPYTGQDVSMLILLPPFVKSQGVESTISKLTPETLKIAREYLTAQTVQVALPKFALEHNIDNLREIFFNLGVTDLFTPNANLTGFIEEGQIMMSDAIHKARVEVTEEGTTAAAATALVFSRSSRPLDPPRFICNHPFVFLILDNLSHTVLFSGVYRGPKN